MKPINLALNIFLIFILITSIYNKRQLGNDQDYLLFLIIILIILICLCSCQTVEKLSNEISSDDIKYDFDTFTTKELKVMKKLEGLKEQIKNSIPIGYVYLSTKDTNPSSFLGGSWKSLNLNSNTENQYTFIMTANDTDDLDYKANPMFCAFKKGVDDNCPNNIKKFDLINNIEYSDGMRTYGGANEIKLTIDNIPPHIHYLRGIKGEKLNSDNETCNGDHPKCSNCYNQSKFGFYIDNDNIVGNATTAKEGGVLKRLTYKDHDKGSHTTEKINRKYKPSVDIEYDKDNKNIKAHENRPPFVSIYGWRKISND